MPSLLTLNRLVCNTLELTICLLSATIEHLEARDPVAISRNRELDDALQRQATDSATSVRPRRVQVDLDVHGTVTLDPDTLLSLLQDIATYNPGLVHPECCRPLTFELMQRLHEMAGDPRGPIEVER